MKSSKGHTDQNSEQFQGMQHQQTNITAKKQQSSLNRQHFVVQNHNQQLENIKKTKERLKQLQAKKGNSLDFNKHGSTTEKNKIKGLEYVRTLAKQTSQKQLKYDKNEKDMIKVASQNRFPTKKQTYLDSQQYKKMHQKLDSIQTKITDMKKNLQKKRQQKQKAMQIKLNPKQKQSPPTKQQQTVNLKGLVTQMPQQKSLHTFTMNPYSPRHNIYYVSELVRAYKDQKSLARQHLVNSLNILKVLQKSKMLSEEEIAKKRLNLPKRHGDQNKKTVIFDLDQTLIHCNDSLNPPYDVKLPIKFPTGQTIEAAINVRPYARQILRNLSPYFQIIVFTASHNCYADVVLDWLDTQNLISHRLYRQNCFSSAQWMYIKDLRVIDRPLSEIILVDNAAYSYAYQLNNGVPILPYYHGTVDFELKMLQQYLMGFVFSKDIRQINEKTFKLTKYKQYWDSPQKLVEELYINR